MTNMTFSLDADLYQRMKQHPEIKWTEILRQSLMNYLNKIENPEKMSVDEFRKKIPPETLDSIDQIDINKEENLNKKISSSERRRTKYLHEIEINK